MVSFERRIVIDHSGAQTPTSNLRGLRVYEAPGGASPTVVKSAPSRRTYWTRRGIAHWLFEQLPDELPTSVGVDHGFCVPLRHFEKHGLAHDRDGFLDDFRQDWPTDADDRYVATVRDASWGDGAARTGKRRWLPITEERTPRQRSASSGTH